MKDLSVIQGDTLDLTLTLDKPNEMVIASVVFDCPSLNIKRELSELSNDEDVWGLQIAPEETSNLRVGRWDYCITATTASDDKYTVIHNGQFIVEYKREPKSPVPPVPPGPGVITGIGWTED